MNLEKLSIKSASDQIQSGDISVTDLVKASLDRIESKDKDVNAFITVTGELALNQAKEIDKKIKKGEKVSKLTGIPFTLKDVFCTEGIKTTAGSKILENYIGQYNATVYQRLLDCGAVLLGKVNCDPFGFGSTTENSAFGITKNPVDLTRVPGGSSGGSGAAVAYGGGLFSIGEDTGGSIRCPASFCGVVGLKVTYGRVSRYGSIAYASSYDTVGPLAKTVEDVAIVMEEIAGSDKMDATSSPETVPEYTKTLNQSLKGKTIGVPKEYFSDSMDPQVREIVMEAIDTYKREYSCKVVEISLPRTEYALPIYYLIGLSEASSNLARYDGIRFGLSREGEHFEQIMRNSRSDGFGDEERRRIILGTYALSSGFADQYYKKAQKIRTLLREDFMSAFKKVDVIVTPTMPVLPPKIGENISDPLKLWLMDILTVSVNPTGIPSLSLPAGKSKEGLSVGMQIMGPHFSEDLLLNFAHSYEKLFK